jgi:hypothetical protein
MRTEALLPACCAFLHFLVRISAKSVALNLAYLEAVASVRFVFPVDVLVTDGVEHHCVEEEYLCKQSFSLRIKNKAFVSSFL